MVAQVEDARENRRRYRCPLATHRPRSGGPPSQAMPLRDRGTVAFAGRHESLGAPRPVWDEADGRWLVADRSPGGSCRSSRPNHHQGSGSPMSHSARAPDDGRGRDPIRPRSRRTTPTRCRRRSSRPSARTSCHPPSLFAFEIGKSVPHAWTIGRLTRAERAYSRTAPPHPRWEDRGARHGPRMGMLLR